MSPRKPLAALALCLCLLAPPAALAGSVSGVDGTIDVTNVNAAGQAGIAQNGAIVQTSASVPINVATATTTQLVALAAGKAIYVTAWDVVAGGADTVTLEYGSGSSCGTGTTALTGGYPLLTGGGIAKGTGLGPLFIIPAGKALCIVTSAAVQASGSVSYAQF